MVKITGYYQLPGRLPQAVDFSELFDRSFMRRFTHCLRRATRFGSWKEMLDTATDLYARRQLLRE